MSRGFGANCSIHTPSLCLRLGGVAATFCRAVRMYFVFSARPTTRLRPVGSVGPYVPGRGIALSSVRSVRQIFVFDESFRSHAGCGYEGQFLVAPLGLSTDLVMRAPLPIWLLDCLTVPIRHRCGFFSVGCPLGKDSPHSGLFLHLPNLSHSSSLPRSSRSCDYRPNSFVPASVETSQWRGGDLPPLGASPSGLEMIAPMPAPTIS